MSGQPDELAKPAHLGEIVRCLREAGGLTRHQLAVQTKISTGTLRAVEDGTHRLTASMLHQLLQAPALTGLLEWAQREGLTLEQAEDTSQEEPS